MLSESMCNRKCWACCVSGWKSRGSKTSFRFLVLFTIRDLPPNIIDLILLVDVYHEFSHPEQMLAAMRRSLKPDGLIVLVEYRAEDPEVPIKELHKMSKAQVNKELTANGFKLVKEFDSLPWQHMMFFGKDAQD